MRSKRDLANLFMLLALIGMAFVVLLNTYGCAPAPRSEVVNDTPCDGCGCLLECIGVPAPPPLGVMDDEGNIIIPSETNWPDSIEGNQR